MQMSRTGSSTYTLFNQKTVFQTQSINSLSRKRNRLIFLHKLQNEPDKIHCNSWKGWLRPVESAAEAESYKETMPEFREITAAFEKQKAVLTARKDLLIKRKSLYDKNKDVFKKLEETLSGELPALEKRMANMRTSHARQNSASPPQAR